MLRNGSIFCACYARRCWALLSGCTLYWRRISLGRWKYRVDRYTLQWGQLVYCFSWPGVSKRSYSVIKRCAWLVAVNLPAQQRSLQQDMRCQAIGTMPLVHIMLRRLRLIVLLKRTGLFWKMRTAVHWSGLLSLWRMKWQFIKTGVYRAW